MISIVLTFALITAIGEFLILHYMPLGMKLRIFGSNPRAITMHMCMAAFNLWIHWGTITGSMTAVTAFVVSCGVIWLARLWYGFIRNGKYYPGFVDLRSQL